MPTTGRLEPPLPRYAWQYSGRKREKEASTTTSITTTTTAINKAVLWMCGRHSHTYADQESLFQGGSQAATRRGVPYL